MDTGAQNRHRAGSVRSIARVAEKAGIVARNGGEWDEWGEDLRSRGIQKGRTRNAF